MLKIIVQSVFTIFLVEHHQLDCVLRGLCRIILSVSLNTQLAIVELFQ